MNFQRPLAILLSMLLVAQPAVAVAARNAPTSPPMTSLQPVFNQLNAGGYQDKATQQDLEAAMAAIVESMPAESVQQMQEVAEFIASNPTDEATLQQAREKFEQTVAALPPETQQLIEEFITGGLYIAGISFAIAAIIKFKQHKDNPTQIPIGTPVALLFIAAALLFLPTTSGVTAVQDCEASAPSAPRGSAVDDRGTPTNADRTRLP